MVQLDIEALTWSRYREPRESGHWGESNTARVRWLCSQTSIARQAKTRSCSLRMVDEVTERGAASYSTSWTNVAKAHQQCILHRHRCWWYMLWREHERVVSEIKPPTRQQNVNHPWEKLKNRSFADLGTDCVWHNSTQSDSHTEEVPHVRRQKQMPIITANHLQELNRKPHIHQARYMRVPKCAPWKIHIEKLWDKHSRDICRD